MSEKFTQKYKMLNLEQKEAVDTVEGPVMVVAGPGTGKTQILTLRIANILKQTDTNPENILALTFTEAGAYEMRKRLVEIIGPTAYRIGINTFHGFANKIIQSNPDRFSNIIGASNINIIDQIKILQNLIDDLDLKKLKPFGNKYYYLRPALTVIGKMKKENISVKKLKKLIKGEEEKNKEKFEELYVLYRAYQEELRKNFLYDYDDMVMEVIRVLEEDEDLLLSLQETYQYILADEHQDANESQNRLLELLASYYDSPNLFVVGDEKQSIFRFQGASLDNFNYFKNKFPKTKLITLKTNYRSEQFILDTANGIIPDGKLFSNKKGTGKVGVSEYLRIEDEAYDLKNKISKLIKDGVVPGEIAVLYRDNKDALPIISVLEKSDIPFVIESDQDILADIDIRKLILLMRVVLNPDNKEYLSQALHIDFLNTDSTEVYKYIRGEDEDGSISDLVKKIRGWRKTSINSDLVTFFEILVRESGFLSHVISSEDSMEKMEKLDTLFDEIKELVQNHRNYDLHEFINYIDLIEEHNILIKKNKRSGFFDSVRLMTAHRSKGQEFDHVFIFHVTDGHWGNRVIRSGLKPSFLDWPGGDEDERKLFFVAITRARKTIDISYHTQSRSGKSLLPSQYIYEIDENLLVKKDYSKDSFDLEIRTEQYKEKKKTGPSLSDKKYLQELFENRPLSVSALNNYLSCPWRYFYRNLIRIPTALSKHQMYGIAIHAALKEFFDLRNEGEKLSSADLVKIFELTLKREPVSDNDYKEMFEKGSRALTGYFESTKSELPDKVITEMSVDGVSLGDITLTGKLDRVDILNSGVVRVVDYKTGKPKSRNEIVGKTGDRRGDMFRQIVFYKILLDGYEGGKLNMIEGVIDFVEPNERGYYKSEKFEVTSEDMNLLKEKIQAMSKDVRNFNFWNKGCGEVDCEFCNLRKIM